MNLASALRLLPPPGLYDLSPEFAPIREAAQRLALVGAGGKTTALFQLSRQLALPARLTRPVSGRSQRHVLDRPVIVTATTHLHVDQIRLADSHWMIENPADLAGLEKALSGVMLVTGPLQGNRTRALDDESLSWLRTICDRHGLPLLIESDGSRLRPLKAPEEHEPPIPDFVGTVVVVAGLSGLGKPLTSEFVHRPGIFARLSGLAPGGIITPDALIRVLSHPDGGLKNIPTGARRLVLLNQADTPGDRSIGGKLAQELLKTFDAVIVGALQHAYLQTFEPCAGIVLAAGASSRFGRPKQLLDFRGQPFVRVVAKNALAGGLSPVVVVTGANAEAVEAALQDLPVLILRNTDWENGQSSSIKTGLQALLPAPRQVGSPVFNQSGANRPEAGAAIFLLADQPQIPPTLVQALVNTHSLELAPIVAPFVRDRRANPVLFDRLTFPDLLSLTGDVGGRAIFNKYQVTQLPWHDENLLMDIDTPEDLERLMELEQ